MPKRIVYIHAEANLAKEITSLVSEIEQEVIVIEGNFPLSLLDDPSLVFWQDPPSRNTPVGKFLRLLHSQEHSNIIVGTNVSLLRKATKYFRGNTETADLKTEDNTITLPANTTPEIKDLTEKDVVLVAPNEGKYNDFLEALANANVSCKVVPIPSMTNQKTVAEFKSTLRSAEAIFVWLVDGGPKGYDRIATVINKMMHKDAILCNGISWRTSLKDRFDIDAPEKEKAAHVCALPATLPDGESLSKTIRAYLNLMHQFQAYKSLRTVISHGFSEDSSLNSLIKLQRRWEGAALSYRQEAALFKPYQAKPLPTGLDEFAEDWERLQSLTEHQSHLAKVMHEHRELIMQSLGQSEAVQHELADWPDVEDIAQAYFSRILFREHLFIELDAFKAELTAEEVDDSTVTQNTLFNSKDNKQLLESEALLTQRMQNNRSNWTGMISAEKDSLAKDLIDRYWQLYSETAIVWTQLENRKPFKEDKMRRFLRMGQLSPVILPRPASNKKIENIIYEERGLDFTFADAEIRALYFDEVLLLLAENKLSPSYDENLELNARGCDEWKRDRKLRRVAAGYRKTLLFNSKKTDNLEVQKGLEEKLQQREELETTMHGTALADHKQESHTLRIVIKRHREHDKAINNELRQLKSNDTAGLYDEEIPLSHWVKKEVVALRRKTRLLNHLRESHVPEILVSECKSSNVKIATPEQVEAQFTSILVNDIALCDINIVKHKKRDQALFISCPPVVIIAPGQGEMGLCLEPQDDIAEGCLLLPTFISHNQGLRYLLGNCFSDYRWDSAMHVAGADWVASDTIVAAYARCRWNYRNKNKEVREKAQIYKEENDKRNFRRHYRLFESSAQEGGKLLYFKSKQIYNELIPYFVLPKDIKRLRDS